MPKGYGSQADFMDGVVPEATERSKRIEAAIRNAFRSVIRTEQVEVISFCDMSALELAHAIESYPIILKPLLAACNIAGRSIERDLQIKNVDTYSDKIEADHAKVIAGYIMPFLPPTLPLPALVHIDRVAFIDKEIRKKKGQWEKKIVDSLCKISGKPFHKCKFYVGGQAFEIDAAYCIKDNIKLGVDIKRIEARRDIHKRCDEIVNKALKLRKAFPKSKFAAVIYYPFIEEHSNIRDRLSSLAIASVVFASESKDSIYNAVKMLLDTVGSK